MAHLGSRALGGLCRHLGVRRVGDMVGVRRVGNTVGEMVELVTSQLEAGGVPEARISAQYIVGSVIRDTNSSRILPGDYKRQVDLVLSNKQEERLRQLVLVRLSRMPVQYILGNWDFHGLTLNMRPPVFIPRPETEQLVDLILSYLPQTEDPLSLLEIGPGSGALSLALLSARSNVRITAVDRSKAAVELTLENAEKLGLQDRLSVVQGRVGDQDDVEMNISQQSFDVIFTNPPYVLRKDLMSVAPEISLYEDLRALDGGSEGLDVILPILDLASKCLKEGGLIFLEVDPCHAHILPPKLVNLDTKFRVDKIVKDFMDKDRFLVLRRE